MDWFPLLNSLRIAAIAAVAVFFLGVAAASGRLGIPMETIRKEIEKRVPEKYLETNIAAFLKGAETGAQYAVK